MSFAINDALAMAEADALYYEGLQVLAESKHKTADEARHFFVTPFSIPAYPNISITYDKETDNLLVRSTGNPLLEVAVCYYRGCSIAVALFNIGCDTHRKLGNPPIELEDEDDDEGEKCPDEVVEENAMDVDDDGDSLPSPIAMDED